MQPLGCNKSQTLFGQQMVHTFSNSINCWQWISLICTWWCISAHIWRQKCHCILLNVITHSSDTERFSRALECEGCSPKDHVSAFNDCCIKRTRRSKEYLGPQDSCWHFQSKEIQMQRTTNETHQKQRNVWVPRITNTDKQTKTKIYIKHKEYSAIWAARECLGPEDSPRDAPLALPASDPPTSAPL